MKDVRDTLCSLIDLLGRKERPIDLRPEDGPTVWPLLFEAAGGDIVAAVCAMHRLEHPDVNVARGGFFLPWSRRQGTLALIVSLQAALECLCECGRPIPDPEDATYCPECQVDQDIHSYEIKMEGGRS